MGGEAGSAGVDGGVCARQALISKMATSQKIGLVGLVFIFILLLIFYLVLNRYYCAKIFENDTCSILINVLNAFFVPKSMKLG